jgi:hypothetical protein
MEASSSAPNELAQLLLQVVSTLPPETHPLVLRHLPVPELARLSCVHKALHVAWKSLQAQYPGKRYSPPTANVFQQVQYRKFSRLERAAAFGDVAVIRTMIAAGVDEHGKPLLEARGPFQLRTVDKALWRAAFGGHVLAVELLLGSGADVHSENDEALWEACRYGHTDVVQLLIIQHGANVHAANNRALQEATRRGHKDVAQLLIQHGARMPPWWPFGQIES